MANTMLDRTNLYRLHCYEKRTNANLSKEYVDKLSSVARIIIREKDIITFKGLLVFNETRNSFIGVETSEKPEKKVIDGSIDENGRINFSVRREHNAYPVYYGLLKGTETSLSKHKKGKFSVNSSKMILMPIMSEIELFEEYVKTRYSFLSRRVKPGCKHLEKVPSNCKQTLN